MKPEIFHATVDKDPIITGDIWVSDEPYRNLEILCDGIGSRMVGSMGERKAWDFIFKKFKEYRLDNVRLEPFECLAWERGKAALKIIKPLRKDIEALSLVFVPSTSSQGITGEFVCINSKERCLLTLPAMATSPLLPERRLEREAKQMV